MYALTAFFEASMDGLRAQRSMHARRHAQYCGCAHLHKEAQVGHQCQPAVLNLLDLELGKCIRIIGQAQGVKHATRVQWFIAHLACGAPVDAVGLSQAQQQNLKAVEYLSWQR